MMRINSRDFRVYSSHDFAIQTLHTVGSEGRLQGTKLVNNASKTPDITFQFIRLVLPDFWARIIGSPGLGVGKLFFH